MLTIGALTLDPAFSAGTYEYTAATTNATNTVTATAAKSGAKVEIKVNDVAHTSGTAATWEDGENTVEVKVTFGTTTKTYMITVTKSGA